MSLRIATCAAILFTVLAAPAHAQAPTKLTEAAIRAYYAELSSLFKEPLPKFMENYEHRIHSDLLYISKTSLLVPGQPRMEAPPVTVTKSDLLGNAERAYESAKGATLSNNIQDIAIAPGGKTARVQNTSSIKDMNFPTSDGSPMKADSIETCIDELILDQSIVKIIKSECSTQITIHPPKQ